jgi:hypothetical protein
VASTLGVLLGWPVAGVAFVPFILHVLRSRHLLRSCATLFATVLPVLVLLLATDSYFYGRQTVCCASPLAHAMSLCHARPMHMPCCASHGLPPDLVPQCTTYESPLTMQKRMCRCPSGTL